MNQNLDERCFALTDFTLFNISGDDAESFLQGQITCDVQALTPGSASMAACCNPKGQVLANFILLKQASDFIVVVPTSNAQPLIDRLKRYVLRSKVRFQYPVELQLGGLHLDTHHPLFSESDSDFTVKQHQTGYWLKWPGSGYRYAHINSEASAVTPPSNTQMTAWRLEDIANKIPWITPPVSEQYTPQMLNLEQLGALSFSKGCYTGQEIVARTHYLGKAKRGLFAGKSEGTITQAFETLKVLHGDDRQSIGNIINLCNTESACHVLMVLTLQDETSNQWQLDDSNHTLVSPLP